MSELSFIILLLSDLKRERISFLSTMQILHCSVRDDFIHLIPSPCQRMVGVIISFIICRTWLLLLQSLHKLDYHALPTDAVVHAAAILQ